MGEPLGGAALQCAGDRARPERPPQQALQRAGGCVSQPFGVRSPARRGENPHQAEQAKHNLRGQANTKNVLPVSAGNTRLPPSSLHTHTHTHTLWTSTLPEKHTHNYYENSSCSDRL